MKKRMPKIDEQCSLSHFKQRKTFLNKALVALGASVFFCAGCFMSKAQGDLLTIKVRDMESEVAKFQRVRHEMEILLSGQVRDLIDRLDKMERQLVTVRETVHEGSSHSQDLVSEIQNLRGQLEEAQYQYRNLEKDQKSLAQNQLALKEETNKIKIPPLKKDHFELAKKLHEAAKYEDSLFLLDAFVKEYAEKDKEMAGQAYFLMGENNRKIAENKKTPEEAEKYSKIAIVHYQKIVDLFKSSTLREEALFKIGTLLRTMGNNNGAKAAFNELLSSNKASKRAKEAKQQLASLKDDE